MRVWKWPWTAVATIPTTLQQIEFEADQITKERVGVSVTGMAVYRIAQPEIAYQLLNSRLRQASQRKARAAAQRHVHRCGATADHRTSDSIIAWSILQGSSCLVFDEEIAPVVLGNGMPDDTTDQGWGVK